MAPRVRIAGLREFSGLVTFGGRVGGCRNYVDDSHNADIDIHLSGGAAEQSYFWSTTDDAIIKPFLLCYVANPRNGVQTISVKYGPDHHQAAINLLEGISNDIRISPEMPRCISNGHPPTESLLEHSNEEGKRLLAVKPGHSPATINKAFEGYSNAADLYFSALYVMDGLESPLPWAQVLKCFSNLLFTCLKIEAFDVAGGVIKNDLVHQVVRNEELPKASRGLCLLRIARVHVKLKAFAEAINAAIAAWHLCPDEPPVRTLVQQLLAKDIPHVPESTDECMLCLQTMDVEQRAAEQQIEDLRTELGCGHVFHTLCIDPWLRFRNNTCPTCRAPRTMGS